MRIALVHPFSWPEVLRGGERTLHELGWYLASVGHEVDLITGSWEGAATTQEDGVIIRRHQLRRPARLAQRGVGEAELFGATALAALTRRRYDVVHTLTPAGVIAARLTGHRCVFTALGHPSERDLIIDPVFGALFRSALLQADAVVAVSESAARRVGAIAAGSGVGRKWSTAKRNRRLMRAEGPGNWLRIIEPAIRLDQFTPDLRPRQGPVQILFASDASEIRKGVHYALAAVDRLRRHHPDARLVLCGPGDASWAVEGLGPPQDVGGEWVAHKDPLAITGAGEPGRRTLEEATELLGPRAPTEMPEQYRAATVTLLPSWEEAFGLVLAESLACGTPGVAFREGGMPEIISRPEVGRTAAFGDVADLTRALAEAVELARDPATPARCSEHARRWGWVESAGPAHEELYHSVARR